jgi:hypothetical protein
MYAALCSRGKHHIVAQAACGDDGRREAQDYRQAARRRRSKGDAISVSGEMSVYEVKPAAPQMAPQA